MRASQVWLFTLLLFYSCATSHSSPRFYARTLKKEIEKSPVFAKSFTGFTLLDPETGKILCDVNGGHYFTPASTMKILTMATCLAVLGDSVPGMQIWKGQDCLYFRGTGDPTFLHTKFRAWQQIAARLNNAPEHLLVWIPGPKIEPLGPGWAWDDALFAFSAERSALPVYGNTERIYASRAGFLSAEPGYFQVEKSAERLGNNNVVLDLNTVYYGAEDTFSKNFEKFIPIRSIADIRPLTLGPTITGQLLGMGLRTDMTDIFHHFGGPSGKPSIFYSAPLDTVLRRMMYQSDNFIAEQMLVVCNGVKYDTLAQNKIIQWAKDTLFASPITNNQSPNNQILRWVDGSGLSRYNLVTPQYFTQVLFNLWREQPHDRLFHLFPTAGAPETTLDWWEPVPARPWLYAKTGSMSGVQCMSGYLRTKRGKWLIFSFMHNNFVGSGKPWRLEMQRVLELAR